MTIVNSTPRVSLNCDGVSKVFQVPLQAYQPADLTVTLTAPISAGGGQLTLTLNSDYTLATSGSLQPTQWTLTTLAASAYLTGYTLQVFVNPVQQQQTQYVQGQAFPSAAIQANVDRLTQMVQRISDQVSRAIHVGDGDVNPQMVLPAAAVRALLQPIFDINGNLTVGVPNTQVITSALLALFLGYSQTAAEAAAGITPVNIGYPPNNMLRYGIVANSTLAGPANLAAMKALFNPAFPNGPTGNFVFPNLTGQDVYTIGAAGSTCVVPMRNGCHLDGQEVTCNFVGTGTSADNNSGMFMWLSNCSIINMSINSNWLPGGSTSSGNCICIGARGTDSSYFGGPSSPYPTGVWDSLLTTPQGNSRIANVRLGTNGGTPASLIQLVGGIQGLTLDGVIATGNGTMTQAITYEFGWATNDTQPSARQSSHMHDSVFKNIELRNFDNVAATSGGLVFLGAYNIVIENIWATGMSNAVLAQPGEAMFYRPWVGVDDTGGKRCITMRNIVAQNVSNAGIFVDGTVKRIAGSTYLQRAWVANTAYGARETVVNGGNMYVVHTPGTSGNAGGPTGTGSNIADPGGVSLTWDFVPLTANTDLLEFSLDGAALNGNSAASGVYSAAGYAKITNTTTIGCLNGLVLTQECTRFDVSMKITGAQQAGVLADFVASQIWGTARPKRGRFHECYVAGNSVSSAGTYGGVSIRDFDGLTFENCRFGFEAAFSFLDEATQGQAVFFSASTGCLNALIRGCRVGGSVGGNGFVNNSGSNNGGSRVENCTFNAGGPNPVTSPISGALMTDFESATAPAIVNGATIVTNGVKTGRVSPAGAVSGISLGAGSYQGQTFFLINEAGAANTVTFAVAGTSRVASGTSAVVAGLTSRLFVWDTVQALWY